MKTTGDLPNSQVRAPLMVTGLCASLGQVVISLCTWPQYLVACFCVVVYGEKLNQTFFLNAIKQDRGLGLRC